MSLNLTKIKGMQYLEEIYEDFKKEILKEMNNLLKRLKTPYGLAFGKLKLDKDLRVNLLLVDKKEGNKEFYKTLMEELLKTPEKHVDIIHKNKKKAVEGRNNFANIILVKHYQIGDRVLMFKVIDTEGIGKTDFTMLSILTSAYLNTRLTNILETLIELENNNISVKDSIYTIAKALETFPALVEGENINKVLSPILNSSLIEKGEKLLIKNMATIYAELLLKEFDAKFLEFWSKKINLFPHIDIEKKQYLQKAFLTAKELAIFAEKLATFLKKVNSSNFPKPPKPPIL